jgi:hypothetical protein
MNIKVSLSYDGSVLVRLYHTPVRGSCPLDKMTTTRTLTSHYNILFLARLFSEPYKPFIFTGPLTEQQSFVEE